MLQNFLSKHDFIKAPQIEGVRRPWAMAIVLVIWVLVGFFTAELLTQAVVLLFKSSFSTLNPALYSAITAMLVYAFALTIVIGGPWLAIKQRPKRETLGLSRLPEWFDFLMAPAGLVIYFLLSGILLVIASHIPAFNPNQTQNTGFSQLVTSSQYVLAFITLVVIAPFSEEILFRGFLFGRLRKIVPLWLAILLTSALFGFLHGEWNVGLDTFSLSVVLCLLRVYTGSIWSSIMLHMIKNAIAYYILFINPS
jgi:membrane protease YdiL (CAAX protease family)